MKKNKLNFSLLIITAFLIWSGVAFGCSGPDCSEEEGGGEFLQPISSKTIFFYPESGYQPWYSHLQYNIVPTQAPLVTSQYTDWAICFDKNGGSARCTSGRKFDFGEGTGFFTNPPYREYFDWTRVVIYLDYYCTYTTPNGGSAACDDHEQGTNFNGGISSFLAYIEARSVWANIDGPGTMGVGQTFSFPWSSKWTTSNSTVSVTGPLSCNPTTLNDQNNPASGNISCTATGSGNATLKITSRGYAQSDGVKTVDSPTIPINITTEPPPDNPNVYRCSGAGTCIYVGYDGSGTTSDPNCNNSCSAPPSPPPPNEPPLPPPGVECYDDANVDFISGPTTLAPGATGTFQVGAANTGNDYWYHGTVYKLVQISDFSINPSYGHLPYIVGSGGGAIWNFDLTAPTTPGTYTFKMQMRHTGGQPYEREDHIQCSDPAPAEDLYFGQTASKTFTVSGTPPTPVSVNVTLSADMVKADNETPYTITVTGTDNRPGAVASNIISLYSMINFQGANGDQTEAKARGYITWFYDPNASLDGITEYATCTGSMPGTHAAKQPSWGSQYIHINSCVISDSGNTRTATFGITVDPAFTSPTFGSPVPDQGNDISGWAQSRNFASYPTEDSGWTNFEINFGLIPPNMSGTLTPASPSCNISQDASSCNINFSWTTTNPVGTSAVTSNTNNSGASEAGFQVATGNSGSNVAFAVPYLNNGVHASRNFYLYNSGAELATSSVYSSCAQGTSWNNGTGKCVTNGQAAVHLQASPISGAFTDGPLLLPSGSSFKLKWTTIGAPTSCTATTNGGFSTWYGSKSVSGGTDTISAGLPDGNYTFTMSCTNSVNGSGGTSSVIVSLGSTNSCFVTVTNPGSAGIVTGSGIDCGNGSDTCVNSYSAGAPVSLSATPSSAFWQFSGWSGVGTCTTGDCNFDCFGTAYITANFNSRIFNFIER